MTLWREQPGRFPVWRGEPIGEGDDAISYPLNIDILPADELEAIGLWRDDMIAAADRVPEGKVVTGTTVQRVDGIVKYVHSLEDFVEPVPQSVTRRQARLALLQAGLLDLVETAIEAMDEPARSAARIEWEDATEIRRDHSLIAALAEEVELTGEQIDNLFKAAAAL